MKNTKKQYLRKAALLCILFSGIFHTNAQNQVLPLWNKIPDEIKAPDYKEKEVVNDGKVQSTSMVTKPTLTAFFLR